MVLKISGLEEEENYEVKGTKDIIVNVRGKVFKLEGKVRKARFYIKSKLTHKVVEYRVN